MAIRVMVPGFEATRLSPVTDAIDGSDEEKTQAAGELEVGALKGISLVAPGSSSVVMSLNSPAEVVGATA